MTEEEMFEKSFERPRYFFNLPMQEQWAIDARLGILDWEGGNLTPAQQKRFEEHYED